MSRFLHVLARKIETVGHSSWHKLSEKRPKDNSRCTSLMWEAGKHKG